MSKYDWSNVPENIYAIATCEDGTVKWFCYPMQTGDSWVTCFTVTGAKPYDGDWKDSLEKRP